MGAAALSFDDLIPQAQPVDPAQSAPTAVASPVAPVDVRPLPPVAGTNSRGQPLAADSGANQYNTGISGITFDDLIPAKVSPMEDVIRSAESGPEKGFAAGLDFISPMIPGLNVLERATSGGLAGGDPLHPGHFVQNALSAITHGQSDYKPTTTPGRYVQTAGEYAPAALMGEGSIPARAANALVPAVVSQFAGDTAHDMGASPAVERAVRVGGALTGAAAGSVRLAPAAAEAAAPTINQVEAAKTAAYKAVDNSGVKFTPEAFSDLTQKIAKAMDEAGFSAGQHPKASNMIKDIGASMRAQGGYSPTLSQLDKLRFQIGRDVASASDKGDRAMGVVMRKQIDNFINSAGPDEITGAADPAAGAALLTTARDMNTRLEKLKSLDNLDEAASDRAAATGTGANGENAARQNMIRFKNSTDNLTPDEKAAVQKAIDGTFGQNALRYVGARLGSTDHILPAILTHGASLPVTLPATVAGVAAKATARGMENAKIQAVRDLIASGGKKIDLKAGNALAPKRGLLTYPDPLVDQLVPAGILSGPAAETATPSRQR